MFHQNTSSISDSGAAESGGQMMALMEDRAPHLFRQTSFQPVFLVLANFPHQNTPTSPSKNYKTGSTAVVQAGRPTRMRSVSGACAMSIDFAT
jgi:hypothetical protein